MSKYQWTSKVDNVQNHKETDSYTYTEETVDGPIRNILSDDKYANKAIELLDSQGRHRSQWAYAPYDGRVWDPKDGTSPTTANKSKSHTK